MDRLSKLRNEAGTSRDSSIDTSTTSEAYVTANESSSKYFSLAEEDSSFELDPIRDVSLASTAAAEKPNTGNDLISELSPIPKQSDLLDSYKFGKQIEAANILSGGVNIFDDNESSYDGNELVIDDNVIDVDDKCHHDPQIKVDENRGLPFQKEDGVNMAADVASKDTEVVLQIDGKNVNAINIGNGLYLYRKEGQEELAAVQIIDDEQPQPSFKFLKVRENAEGNLEVYEEIEVEVPKETCLNEARIEKNLLIEREVIADPIAIKSDAKISSPPKDSIPVSTPNECLEKESSIEVKTDSLNSKMTKFNETRKSPVIHSTPNKEGIPLTKTMVNQKLHPNRHSDKVKTIEVHIDSTRQKLTDTPTKNKDITEGEIEKTPESTQDEVKTHGKSSPVIKEKVPTGKSEPSPDLKNGGKIEQKSSISEVSNNEEKLLEQSDYNQQLKPETLEFKKNLEMPQEKLENVSRTTNPKNILEETVTESRKLNSSDKETACSLKLDIHFGKANKHKNDPQTKFDESVIITEATPSQISKESANVNDKINKIADTATGQQKQVDNEPVLSSQITPEEVHSLKHVQTIANAKEDNIIERSKDVDDSSKMIEPIKSADKPVLITTQKLGTSQEFIPPFHSGGTIINNLADPVNHINTKEDTKLASVGAGEVNSSNTKVSQKNIQSASTEKINMKHNILNPEDKEEHTKSEQQGTSSSKVVENTSCQILQTATQDQSKNTSPIKQDLSSVQLPTAAKFSTKSKEETLIHDKMLSLKEDIKEILPPVIVSAKNTAIMNKHGDTKTDHENKTKDFKSSPETNIQHSAIFPPKLQAVKVYSKPTDTNKEKMRIPDKSGVKSTPASTSTCFKPMMQNETSKHVDIKPDASKTISTRTNVMPVTVRSLPDSKTNIRKEIANVGSTLEKKPYNNNHAAVPFGKWTEANRQEFLNKIKESKVTSTITNTKQIKQPNDLNKREFLQKIDVYRIPTSNTTVKSNEEKVAARLDVRTDTKTYKIKPATASRGPQMPVKCEVPFKSNVPVIGKQNKAGNKLDVPKLPIKTGTTVATATSQEPHQIRNNQDLIDKTIEGIINRVITAKPEELMPIASNERKKESKVSSFRTQDLQPKDKHPASLDALEMKMNELHGIPFVERPPHQLPKPYNPDIKTYSQAESLKNTSAVKETNTSSQIPLKIPSQNVDVDSEEEVIEHQPITGDIDFSKRCNVQKIPPKLPVTVTSDVSKNEAIITETDFDKFARRNSFTCENRLTVKFEGNESNNVVQKIVEKEPPQVKKYSRNELLLAEAKVKSDQKQLNRINHPVKSQGISKMLGNDDTLNRNYQSKFQIAYQSALTAKRKTEPPITIIEDKPVKVLFIDTNPEFTPSKLNVLGTELSPVKKRNMVESDTLSISPGDSIDSTVTDNASKLQDDNKAKTKHQRKQVLTPVETPELELIEPRDLGLTGSPKKKSKTEDVSVDKSPKSVVPKKSYLLGRNTVVEETASTPHDLTITKNLRSNVIPQNVILAHKDTASAIDNLVKAAELLETQSEHLNSSTVSVNSDNSGTQPSPAKRGRGRPRKHPIGDGPQITSKVSSAEQKPQLIEAKPVYSTQTDDDTSDDEMVRENWTIGKIDENIVCPICKKLFRSENVVFKHVKHCTGPSPNRSESDKQSRRSRQSQESETKSVESKSEDVDYEPPEQRKQKKATPKKRKSKDIMSESSIEKDDVIVIPDTPNDKPSQQESRISGKPKILSGATLACDICGKRFRQLSYLVSHKWQHQREESKKIDHDAQITAKTVFRCEVCKKQFRKLHHLVQHRLIHNPSSAPTRSSRKSSAEQTENKMRDRNSSKPVEDPSAAFRCEPCDKSFRKLHHLVEHRETHDGQNRQKNMQANQAPEEKVVVEPPPQCDICKKTFRKLHYLIEHKEQHLETSSDRSDDKSIKSSLSTKDIIHECRLCYMVFPNEHSLNKHSVFCQKKKKPKVVRSENEEIVENKVEVPEMVKENVIDTAQEVAVNKHAENKELTAKLSNPNMSSVNEVRREDVRSPEKDIPKEHVVKSIDSTAPIVTEQKDEELVSSDKDKIPQAIPKIKKIEGSTKEVSSLKAVPRRKTLVKDKSSPLANKRQKINTWRVSRDVTVPDSSDDDEVRYMLNPDFRSEPSMLFMEVRTKKRSSLQIEKPNKDSVKRRASDSVKRRPSLQNPPKIPRLKAKSIETKVMPSKTTAITKNIMKIKKAELAPSTDSDDSDVKYSFPEPVVEESKDVEVKKVKREDKEAKIVEKVKREDNEAKTLEKVKQKEKEAKTVDKVKREDKEAKTAVQVKRKSVADKRKSLSGIAKRKSIGKPASHKQNKEKEMLKEPVKVIKRRTLGVEHRCDCGQLFSSAALLARHTTLAHTPPRIRRRRSPAPTAAVEPAPQTANPRKASRKSEPPKPTRKSSGKTEKKNVTLQKISKSAEKNDSPASSAASKSTVKTKAAHKGVPVPEKMKKLAEKFKG